MPQDSTQEVSMPKPEAHNQSIAQPSTDCDTIKCHTWERPSIPQGWEFDEFDSYISISSRMGCIITTQGDRWTTYLALNSIQEAYAVLQYLKKAGLAQYATLRSPGKRIPCKAELKIWGLNDDYFNTLCDAFTSQDSAGG